MSGKKGGNNMKNRANPWYCTHTHTHTSILQERRYAYYLSLSSLKRGVNCE